MAVGKSRIAEAYLQIIPVLDGMSDEIAKQVKQGVDDANKEVEKESEEVGKKSGKGMAKGLAIAAGAGAIAVAIGSQIKKGIDQAIEQTNITSKMDVKLNLDENQSKAAKEVVKDIYTSGLGESFEEVSNSVSSIMGTIKGAKNASKEELTEMSRDVMNLSSVYDLEAGEISRAVNGMIGTGFAKNSKDAFQIIYNGFQEMGDYGTEWVDTLREFTGDFKTFGLDGEAAVNLMTRGMDAGIMQTDIWSDALNELNIRLNDGSADKELKFLKLNPKKIREDIKKGGAEAQKAFVSVMQALQKSGDMNMFAKIIGSVGEDYKKEFMSIDFTNLNNGISNSTMKLDELDKKLNSGAGQTFESLMRTLQQALVDILLPVLEQLTPMFEDIAEWVKNNTGLIEKLVPVIGVVLVAAIGLAIVALMGMAAAGIAAIAPFLPIIGLIALIVAAIAGLVAGIWWLVENWSEVTQWIQEAIANVGQFFVDVWTNVSSWFSGILQGMGSWFASVWEGIKQIAANVGQFFVDVWKGFANFFIDTWNNLLNFFIGIYNKIVEFITNIPGIKQISDFLNGTLGINIGAQIPESNVPRMADGGTIKAKSGGTLALLGEAGRDEVVMDAGKWNNMLDQINNNGTPSSNNQTINIYQQPGQSADELIQLMNDRLDFTSLR